MVHKNPPIKKNNHLHAPRWTASFFSSLFNSEKLFEPRYNTIKKSQLLIMTSSKTFVLITKGRV